MPKSKPKRAAFSRKISTPTSFKSFDLEIKTEDEDPKVVGSSTDVGKLLPLYDTYVQKASDQSAIDGKYRHVMVRITVMETDIEPYKMKRK